MKQSSKNKILFCNLAYMRNYDFAINEDIPLRNGVSVGERINFHDWRDGVYRGYVEIGYDNGKHYQVRIENIDGGTPKANMLTNVTVVFCARKDNATKIVGWYKNATVYRNVQEYSGYYYFFETAKENALLLPEKDRSFEIPRANSEHTGFGEKNVWYAQDITVQDLIDRALKYISEYKV